jgi:hypothetical protein
VFESKSRLITWLVMCIGRVRDYVPFTGPGILLFLLGMWSFEHFAISQSDFFVRASIVVFLYLYLGLSFVTMIVRFFVNRRLKNLVLSSEQAQTTRGQRIDVVSSTSGFRVYPLLEVNVKSRKPSRYLIEDAARARHRSMTLIPQRRGTIDNLELTFEVADIFGLNRTLIQRDLPFHLEVQAKQPALESAQLHLPNAGDDSAHPAGSLAGDYVDMRRYAPGDPQRFILWKAFARSRKLLVRTPERAQSKEPAIALVLMTCDHDAEAADVARYFLEQAHEKLAFGAAGLREVAFNVHDALALLKTSGGIDEFSIDAVCDTLATLLKSTNQRVVVVASPEDSVLLQRLTELTHRLGVTPHVILSSSATSKPSNSRWQRLGILTPKDSGSRFVNLSHTIEGLKSSNWNFEIINPESGRRWEANHWHL